MANFALLQDLGCLAGMCLAALGSQFSLFKKWEWSTKTVINPLVKTALEKLQNKNIF